LVPQVLDTAAAATCYTLSRSSVFAMLSSVLKSQRAVQMNILVMRAFVKLRELIASHKDLAARIEKLEVSQDQPASVINLLAEDIENLKLLPPEESKKRIGFIG
jgi:hypothetical protein